MPGVFSIFFPHCDSQDNAAFKNMLLRSWDLQVWKWGVFLEGVDQVYAFDVKIAVRQISSGIARGHSQGRKSSNGPVSLGYCWEQPKSPGRFSAPKVNTHKAVPAYSMPGSDELPAVRKHTGGPELALLSGQWQGALLNPKTNKVCWSLQVSLAWSYLLRNSDLLWDIPRVPILLSSARSCVHVWAVCFCIGFLWPGFGNGWLLWKAARNFLHVWQSQCQLAPGWTLAGHGWTQQWWL